jgi:hypothetical protein
VELSTNFISTLVAEIDHSDYVGILLGGSYVRGDATVRGSTMLPEHCDLFDQTLRLLE